MILSEIEAFDFSDDNKLYKIKFPIKLIDLSFAFNVSQV